METQRIDLDNDGKTKCNGNYYFYVYNFRNNTKTFSSLNTKINVYKNGVKVKTFSANDQEYKKTWVVFKITNQETITEMNQYTNDCSTVISEVDATDCAQIQ